MVESSGVTFRSVLIASEIWLIPDGLRGNSTTTPEVIRPTKDLRGERRRGFYSRLEMVKPP